MKWLKGLFKKESAEDRQRRINALYGGGYQPRRCDDATGELELNNPPQGGSGVPRLKTQMETNVIIEFKGA